MYNCLASSLWLNNMWIALIFRGHYEEVSFLFSTIIFFFFLSRGYLILDSCFLDNFRGLAVLSRLSHCSIAIVSCVKIEDTPWWSLLILTQVSNDVICNSHVFNQLLEWADCAYCFFLQLLNHFSYSILIFHFEKSKLCTSELNSRNMIVETR